MDSQSTAPMPAPAPMPAVAPTPAAATGSWPGAFGIYKVSKAAVMLNIGPILILGIANIVLGMILSSFGRTNSTSSLANGTAQFHLSSGFGGGNIVSNIVSAVFGLAIIVVLIHSVRGQKVSLGEAFSETMKHFLQYVLLSIIMFFGIAAGFLLLIVPAVILVIRWSLAPYFLVDQNMGAIDALKASWTATKGHSGEVMGIIGVSILMAMLIIVIAGIYFLVMYSAAFALLYEYLRGGQTAVVAPSPAAPAVG